ncbi:phosphoheptose isomerase [Nonomuraea sp. NPDC005983]|uniref:phosphoheptose isomerase n=1 Tax=Nonomuraea sp. NPDC005983 TaxID=3155595 RepID=UPI0033A161E7
MAHLLEQAAADRAGPGLAVAEDAAAIVRAARAMAQRFRGGARLVTFGRDGAAADAAHLAVEFTHPVIVGKRALPAISLGDAIWLVPVLGRPQDIAVGIAPGDTDLTLARELGMLTIALTAAGAQPDVDHVLAARSQQPLIVREVHVTIYHLLWELAQVFLESEAPT